MSMRDRVGKRDRWHPFGNVTIIEQGGERFGIVRRIRAQAQALGQDFIGIAH